MTLFLGLGWWQLARARSGNELSWAYVVEWPLFAAVAVAVWRMLLHDVPDYRARLEIHPVSLALGPTTFNRLAYDVNADVMYLHVNGVPPDIHVERCREGHQLRFDERGNVVGLTLVGVTRLLHHGESLVITASERIELVPGALATALGVELSSLASVLLSVSGASG